MVSKVSITFGTMLGYIFLNIVDALLCLLVCLDFSEFAMTLIEKAEKHPLVHKAQVKKLDAEVINAQKHETYLKIKKEFAEDVEYMVQN